MQWISKIPLALKPRDKYYNFFYPECISFRPQAARCKPCGRSPSPAPCRSRCRRSSSRLATLRRISEMAGSRCRWDAENTLEEYQSLIGKDWLISF